MPWAWAKSAGSDSGWSLHASDPPSSHSSSCSCAPLSIPVRAQAVRTLPRKSASKKGCLLWAPEVWGEVTGQKFTSAWRNYMSDHKGIGTAHTQYGIKRQPQERLRGPRQIRHAPHNTAWICSTSYEPTACSPETLTNGLSSSMDLPSRFPERTKW